MCFLVRVCVYVFISSFVGLGVCVMCVCVYLFTCLGAFVFWCLCVGVIMCKCVSVFVFLCIVRVSRVSFCLFVVFVFWHMPVWVVVFTGVVCLCLFCRVCFVLGLFFVVCFVWFCLGFVFVGGTWSMCWFLVGFA